MKKNSLLEISNCKEITRMTNLKINKISVEGFRNIDNISVELSNITGLVGLNGFGKSNFMEAIDFGIDFIKNSLERKSQMMSWSYGVPLNTTIQSKDFLINFEFEKLLGNKNLIINYGYSFSWVRNDESGAKINNEWLKMKFDEKGQKFNSLIIRDKCKAFYKSSETSRCNKLVQIEENELVINKLRAFDDLYFIEIIKEINQIKMHYDRHLDASSSYEPETFVIKGMNELDLNSINNIPKSIFFLKKQFKNEYNRLINAFKLLFPQVSEINIDEVHIQTKNSLKVAANAPFAVADKIYVMNVTDQNLNQPISFERLSDGAKRVFLMLTYAVMADIKGFSLIAFEEPENSIHPVLLQSYLRVLSELTNDCKILFASHSPYIIQYIDPKDIYVGFPNINNLASFKRIAKTKCNQLINDAEMNDYSTGDYIFNLLSGNEEDIDMLKTYLED